MRRSLLGSFSVGVAVGAVATAAYPKIKEKVAPYLNEAGRFLGATCAEAARQASEHAQAMGRQAQEAAAAAGGEASAQAQAEPSHSNQEYGEPSASDSPPQSSEAA